MKTLFSTSSEIETRGLVHLIRSKFPDLNLANQSNLRDYRTARYVVVDTNSNTITLYDGRTLPNEFLGQSVIPADEIGNKDIGDIINRFEHIRLGGYNIRIHRASGTVGINDDSVVFSFENIQRLNDIVNGPAATNVITFFYDKIAFGESKQRVLIVKETGDDWIGGLDVMDDFKYKRFLKSRIVEGTKKFIKG